MVMGLLTDDGDDEHQFRALIRSWLDFLVHDNDTDEDGER